MSNPSDWNSDEDDTEDEVEGAFEQEQELDAGDDRDHDDEEEEPGEDGEGRPVDAAATGGCLRTMLLAMAFWMAVALAALGFCVVFGGGW
jgi:hypothetical protein